MAAKTRMQMCELTFKGCAEFGAPKRATVVMTKVNVGAGGKAVRGSAVPGPREPIGIPEAQAMVGVDCPEHLARCEQLEVELAEARAEIDRLKANAFDCAKLEAERVTSITSCQEMKVKWIEEENRAKGAKEALGKAQERITQLEREIARL